MSSVKQKTILAISIILMGLILLGITTIRDQSTDVFGMLWLIIPAFVISLILGATLLKKSVVSSAFFAVYLASLIQFSIVTSEPIRIILDINSHFAAIVNSIIAVGIYSILLGLTKKFIK